MKIKNLKILAGVLLILVILTLVVALPDNKKDTGNFKSELLSTNVEDVTGIEIQPGTAENGYKILKKNTGTWEIETNGQQFLAQTDLVDNLLQSITNLKARQVVANRKEKWADFSVDDSLGTRVKLFTNNNVDADFVVGRMSFSQSRNPYQQYPDAFSYIRFKDEEKVYSVEGMLSMTVNQNADDFRDAHILNIEPGNLTLINFKYPSDSSFVMQKVNEKWLINQQPADSTITHTYLQSISNFSNRNFTPIASIQNLSPLFEMNLEGNNMEAVIIKVYPVEGELYVTTSINTQTAFRLDFSEAEVLFRGKDYFLE